MRAADVALVASAVLALLRPTSAEAHRLDEYLQAARVAVASDRVSVELSLTSGTAIAEDVVREIDTNADGMFSRSEQQAYAARVLAALTLSIDDRPSRLNLTAVSFPEAPVLTEGIDPIVIRSEARFVPLEPGAHRLQFTNGNTADKSVYLANALVPEDARIGVTAQERTVDQRDLQIQFVVRPSGRAAAYPLAGGAAATFAVIACVIGQRSRRRNRRHGPGPSAVSLS